MSDMKRGPDTRSFEWVNGEATIHFADVERLFTSLDVDDRAACCAMQPGDVVELGSSTLTRLS